MTEESVNRRKTDENDPSSSSQWGKKTKNSSRIKLQTQSNGKGKRKKPAAETSFEVV